jgi:hypothetical protein
VGAVLLVLLGYSRADYNATVGKSLLYYASATFCEEYSLQSWYCGNACKQTPGVTSVTFVSEIFQGTFGFVVYNNNTNSITVAFRGSYNTANWYLDLDYFFTPYETGPEGAEVHRGFYDAYLGLSYQVIDAVRGYLRDHPDATIQVTGHSLGASIATFAALDIKEQIKPSNKFDFYTFGSPRVGNENFTNYLWTQFPDYYRVTHTNDIVPHLPAVEMGFNHAGHEVWYYDYDNVSLFKICPNKPGEEENWDCSDSYYLYDPGAHLDYLGIDVVE